MVLAKSLTTVLGQHNKKLEALPLRQKGTTNCPSGTLPSRQNITTNRRYLAVVLAECKATAEAIALGYTPDAELDWLDGAEPVDDPRAGE